MLSKKKTAEKKQLLEASFCDSSEMQKAADAADISVLFFLAGANFFIFGPICAILGHFWANFGSFLGYFG